MPEPPTRLQKRENSPDQYFSLIPTKRFPHGRGQSSSNSPQQGLSPQRMGRSPSPIYSRSLSGNVRSRSTTPNGSFRFLGPYLPQVRQRRSNSLARDDSKLEIQDRNRIGGSLQKGSTPIIDYSIIAVFSREATENFGKKFRDQHINPSEVTATKTSYLDLSEKDRKIQYDSRSSLQAKTEVHSFEEQVQALLRNKTTPHVIAVIEGEQEKDELEITTQSGEKVIYNLKKFFMGKNMSGNIDKRQSMAVYVRKDMDLAYSVEEEKIPVDKKAPIPALSINYKTLDGTAYKSLVVHIPNVYVGSEKKDEDTHQAFMNFANSQFNVDGTVVTSYFGDTNYHRMKLGENGESPSMGGHTSSGTTLKPKSSAADKDTYFMRSIPLGVGNNHSVLQPAMLNLPFLKNGKVGVDHPSFVQMVEHNSHIAGRSYNSSDFIIA